MKSTYFRGWASHWRIGGDAVIIMVRGKNKRDSIVAMEYIAGEPVFDSKSVKDCAIVYADAAKDAGFTPCRKQPRRIRDILAEKERDNERKP